MAVSSIEVKDFNKILIDVFGKLEENIENSRKKGNHPLVVTISRRMPHVMFWYKEIFATESSIKILDLAEIITEIALPFINFSNKGVKYDIFIVDDVVSTGKTLKYIIELTKTISGIDSLNVFTMFCAEDKTSSIRSEVTNLYIGKSYRGKEQHKEIGDYVFSIIAATLPIDVSYPLLYLTGQKEDVKFDNFKLNFIDIESDELENYDVDINFIGDLCDPKGGIIKKKGDKNKSYTSLLPSELSGYLNNDFAKIRTYDRLGRFIVVPYAPNVLRDTQLDDNGLFENPDYRRVWGIILKSSRPTDDLNYDMFDEEAMSKAIIKNRCRRSLVSAANYLYSLSSFNRVIATNGNADKYRFTVSKDDMTLIFGNELTSKIFDIVLLILSNHTISPKVHEKLKVSSVFIPKIYEGEYTFSKYMKMEGNDIKKDVLAIFRNAKKHSSQYLTFDANEAEYSVEGIMETLESLEQALIIKKYEKSVRLNKLIDQFIDEGIVVSRYAYSYDNNKSLYWRRYFRMTSLEV